MGENLPPGDSDWGNQTIASQIANTDPYIVRIDEHYSGFICGIIAKDYRERERNV